MQRELIGSCLPGVYLEEKIDAHEECQVHIGRATIQANRGQQEKDYRGGMLELRGP